jgi:hypothetical protein
VKTLLLASCGDYVGALIPLTPPLPPARATGVIIRSTSTPSRHATRPGRLSLSSRAAATAWGLRSGLV